MSADIVQTIKVRAGDLECSVCTEKFSLENRLPMSLLCGHTFCSYCLTQITKCPTCREKIEQKPQRNTMVCSMIETYSSTSSSSSCSLHLQPCDVLCPKTEQFVCAECYFENNKGIPTLKSIHAKVQKMKEKGDEINKKRQSAIESLEELLLQDKNDAEQAISDAYDEEFARVLSLRKKRKRDVETFYYSKKECFQHELLAADMVKYLEENKRKVDEWKDQQKPKAATEIMETDLDTEGYMEGFDKKVNELKTSIQTRPKNLFEVVEEKSQQHLLSKNCEKAECHYLCQTFEECGITATYEDSQSLYYRVFSLQASSVEPALKRFYPKYFNCSISDIELRCLNNGKFNFGIICNILENVNSLSLLNLQFAEPPFSEFELLSNFILQEKNCPYVLQVQFPVTKTSISCFLKFLATLLSRNKINKIHVYCYNGKLDWRIILDRNLCFLNSCSCQVELVSDNCDYSSTLRENFEALSGFLKSVHLKEFEFDFGMFAKDPASLQHLHYFIENLPDLLNLQLKISSPSLLKNNLLNRVIFEGIIKHKQLKTLALIFPGDPRETSTEIDELCGHLENAEYSNNNLQELSMTFCKFQNINLQKILIFIGCFCQLKILKLRFYLVKKNWTMISEFFKGIHQLQGLEKFIFEFFTAKELSSNQLEELKALLPSSLTESAIVFEKLSSEAASKCYVYLSPVEISQHEDDE